LILFIPFHIVYEHMFLSFILPHRNLIGIRRCAERRKAADRKKKEEVEAKHEQSEEEHHVHML